METHKFTLSGVETEVTFIGGRQQAILTANKSVPQIQKLYDLAKSLTVRVGDFVVAEHSDAAVDEFFKNMLACHVKQILTESRNFTYEGEDFMFDYEYEKTENGKKVKATKSMSVPLEDGFPVKPVMVFDPTLLQGVKTITELKKLTDRLVPLEAKSYDEVRANAVMEYIAPKSGKHMQIRMRDGHSSAEIAAIKKADLNSHAMLLSLLPKYKLEGGDSWVRFTMRDIDNAHSVDLEFMRTIVSLWDGAVDTELEFEHPENEDRKEFTDLMAQPSFFFLSGGI